MNPREKRFVVKKDWKKNPQVISEIIAHANKEGLDGFSFVEFRENQSDIYDGFILTIVTVPINANSRRKLSPDNGGCWFCGFDQCDDYDVEFDTNIHLDCLKIAYENGCDEAAVMSYLLKYESQKKAL
jgi:hypothetical protein